MKEGVLDGEIVAVDGAGKPSFQRLQHLARFGRMARPILYFAFDLLNLNGKDLISLPLVERKRLLEGTLAKAEPAAITVSSHRMICGFCTAIRAARSHSKASPSEAGGAPPRVKSDAD
jgi:ATP-dependent DNA ligase